MILHNIPTFKKKESESSEPRFRLGFFGFEEQGANAPLPRICEKNHLYYYWSEEMRNRFLFITREFNFVFGGWKENLLSIIQFEASPLHQSDINLGNVRLLKMKIVCVSRKYTNFERFS